MLAADPYVASFGRQWNRYDVARHDEDHAVFRVKTGWEPEHLRGRLVLDAGCGGGRYARLLGAHGGRVVGVDLSAAVAKASALCREYPDVLIAQCDLLDLSLADESFDCAFSIGVMPHSPRPTPRVRAGRRQGQAGRRPRGLALSQKHIRARVDQLGAPPRHHADARAGA